MSENKIKRCGDGKYPIFPSLLLLTRPFSLIRPNLAVSTQKIKSGAVGLAF
jgi:hypothetical protein